MNLCIEYTNNMHPLFNKGPEVQLKQKLYIGFVDL